MLGRRPYGSVPLQDVSALVGGDAERRGGTGDCVESTAWVDVLGRGPPRPGGARPTARCRSRSGTGQPAGRRWPYPMILAAAMTSTETAPASTKIRPSRAPTSPPLPCRRSWSDTRCPPDPTDRATPSNHWPRPARRRTGRPASCRCAACRCGRCCPPGRTDWAPDRRRRWIGSQRFRRRGPTDWRAAAAPGRWGSALTSGCRHPRSGDPIRRRSRRTARTCS